jgi:hypothetical protein
MKLRFTKSAVESLEATNQRVYVYDTVTPSLALCIHPTGRKVFFRTGRVDGRYVRHRIGPFPAVTVQAARDKGNQLTSAISAGENPHQERLNCRAGRTRRHAANRSLRHQRGTRRCQLVDRRIV